MIKKFCKLGIKSIVYSMNSQADYVSRALSSEIGAKGYILKDNDNLHIINAINTVCSGGVYVQNELLPCLCAKTTKSHLFFTNKEMQIAKMIVNNYSNDAISKELNISKNTVQNYVSHIYDKTCCDNRFSCIEFLRENL